ncbi:MAG: hypothetical protein ACRC56_13815 [Bosea sp. (in: a-proteobacteria)]
MAITSGRSDRWGRVPANFGKQPPQSRQASSLNLIDERSIRGFLRKINPQLQLLARSLVRNSQAVLPTRSIVAPFFRMLAELVHQLHHQQQKRFTGNAST